MDTDELAPPPDETLLELVDHITTLSSLVTRTSQATSAELQAFAARLDRVAADVDALRRQLDTDQRTGTRLDDEDVRRIAVAVVQQLTTGDGEAPADVPRWPMSWPAA